MNLVIKAAISEDVCGSDGMIRSDLNVVRCMQLEGLAELTLPPMNDSNRRHVA